MSLADFLFSPRQQRLLAPLLLHPGHSYSLSELLRLSGAGRGAGQVQVQKFIDAGLLTEQRLGNQRRIRVNDAFPFYPELRSICLKSFGLTERLRAALSALLPALDEAFVFGSVATGNDRPDSDIDLMVIGEVELLPVMEAIAPLEKDFGRAVHVNLYNRAEWATLSKSDSVLRQIAQSPTIRILPDEATA